MSETTTTDTPGEVERLLPTNPAGSLLMIEVYASVQGESTFTGVPFVLVRTARCNLRCTWCDSAFTFRGGERRSVDEVLDQVRAFGLSHVLVTGGEPLLQPAVSQLMTRLADEGQTVLVETGGSLPIHDLDPRVHRILDVKCPGSGEADRNHWPNLDVVGPLDEVKFVVADRGDYEWAREVVRTHRLGERARAVLISPVHGTPALAPALAEWIVEDRLPARLQLQLHKYLWDPDARER